MKILMVTNTYTPIVGGVEESIRSCSRQLRKLGHEVVIVAPEFAGVPKGEKDVIRIPAIENFNKTDWSVNLPLTGELIRFVKRFEPDIVHSHHPFLLGDVAVRLCAQFHKPLVFTYHTMYEMYTHYLPLQNDLIKRFIVELTAGYANLATHVIAPSESVRDLLKDRGVETPVDVVPTGIDTEIFAHGNGEGFRKTWHIPSDVPVIGHVGRLAPEKNLEFLTEAVLSYIREHRQTKFLVIGKGPSQKDIQQAFEGEGLGKNLVLTGVLRGQDLMDGYHAMNVFAFASQTETQGLVLTEAMAAGVPLVAVDAPGVREVVKDKKNGRLIKEEDLQHFSEALTWCLEAPQERLENLKKEALATANKFSKDNCLTRLLTVYEQARNQVFPKNKQKHDVFRNLKNRFDTEWRLLQNMLEAGQTAVLEKIIDDRYLVKSHLEPFFLKMRRWLSRNEWAARLLKLSRQETTDISPGLILIQIDGFSRTQLKTAMQQDEMPFLRRLMKKERYQLYPFYTGLPSSTPSVQGELFYGVKQVVPAFSYYDKHTQKVFTMYDGDSAVEIEERLKRHGPGLLEGGSSYSNIYQGGAKEAHFCATSLGLSRIWKNAHPLRGLIFFILRLWTVLRMIFLVALELILATIDFFGGLWRGEHLGKEFKFIPTRALICILLRELVTIGSRIDIARGLPIIHMNFIGYDEQAHRRGPSSIFAHHALPGIDAAIASIYRDALYSLRRNYDVWIYSDHGQEGTESYIEKYGETVRDAVAKVFEELNLETQEEEKSRGEQYQRARYLGMPFMTKLFSKGHASAQHKRKVIVTAIGPTGNIYLPHSLNEKQKDIFARKLVQKAKIPLILTPEPGNKARAWDANGSYRLPDDAAQIFGATHPYLKELTKDLLALCHHESSGDFTFCGWRPGQNPLSFPIENGAHAGIGTEETNAFALLPFDIEVKPKGQDYIRTADLRAAALKYLQRENQNESKPMLQIPSRQPPSRKTVRVMTYNVHSCRGLDGKVSPERIARVIARHDADIVALQELDMKRGRTGGVDQPHVIAQHLEMMYHFHPVIRVEEERYGNAILTKYPMDLIQVKRLPPFKKSWKREPRGALWVSVEINGRRVQFINTHLGLSYKERKAQADELINEHWLRHPDFQKDWILVGDFNTRPGSYAYRTIGKYLRDAQEIMEEHRPKATWMSHYPLRRIDHVFVSPQIKVTNVTVSNTWLEKVASDHLPLIVDVQLSD